MRVKAVSFGRSTWILILFAALSLALAPSSRSSDYTSTAADKSASRKQLSIGYSLLYQEADGIPKLKWILAFKDKPEEMGRITNDLLVYYQQLADAMRDLSKKYPAMRIDVEPMSKIEGDTRRAIGEDLAKDLAPLIGKSGIRFEREALLTFYDGLNEQRHLVGVMRALETNPGLKKFLDETKTELEKHYTKIGELLHRRYFIR
jgi:hypothetical protein